MATFVEHEIGMDLVRHHDPIMSQHDCRETLQFRACVGTARRVVRMAEQQHAGSSIDIPH